jgi:AraC family transcriptional regulator of adaptative response/methylated-DNA-[protein]-cysteine methyltransferase
MNATMVQEDPRFRAVSTRDRGADGRFVYAVKTTGVYCRPSCPSRAARPENLRFFESTADAQRAGFRPCLRCRPDQPAPSEQRAALVTELCRFIEGREEPPSLEELAEHAGLSRFHLHRLFKAETGITPKGYLSAVRARRAERGLKTAASITDAYYGAGFGSSGRFYAQAKDRLGMTPSQFRTGARDLPIRFGFGESSLGTVLVAETDRGICAIFLGENRAKLIHELKCRFGNAAELSDDASLRRRIREVVKLVEQPGTQASDALPLDIRGTAFQERVWQALRRIPAGSTRTYSELARELGDPKAVRAVAGACAANPLAVVVPCHRVVRRDGALAGYRWGGIERKRALLEREATASEPRRLKRSARPART